MTNIKITQEAREAAGSLFAKEYGYSGGLMEQAVRRGECDNDHVVQAMQALINQTVERCAKVAEEYKQMGYMSDRERDYCQQHGEEVAAAIRAQGN